MGKKKRPSILANLPRPRESQRHRAERRLEYALSLRHWGYDEDARHQLLRVIDYAVPPEEV